MSFFLFALAAAGTSAQQPYRVAPPPPPPGSYRPYPVPPRPLNASSWFDNLVYPADALRENREGVVAYQLVLDPEGLPTECRVIESSGHADLDALTCDILMKRARFSPARDENNNALGSWYRGRMRWVVPDEVEPAAPATGPNHSAPPPSKEK